MDDLGRVVIPKELRRQMGIKEGDPLEFFIDNGHISLKKYKPIGEQDWEQAQGLIAPFLKCGFALLNSYGEVEVINNPKAEVLQCDVNLPIKDDDDDVLAYIGFNSSEVEASGAMPIIESAVTALQNFFTQRA